MPETEPNRPDTLRVRAEYEEEIPATRADLHVTIRGATLVTGDAALNKAREVRQLADDLRQYGLTDADIKLQGVHAQASSGVFGRSSSAVYALRIRCEKLDRLADVLGIVTAQKNTTLDSLAWGYDDGEETYNRLLARCVERASRKAQTVAGSLGVRLLGVRAFHEPGEPDLYRAQSGEAFGLHPMRASLSRVTTEDLGLEVSHAKTLSVAVEVEYRISAVDSP